MPSSGSTIQRSPLLPGSSRALLAEDAVVRARGGEPRADQLLGGLVGRGHEVGRRALGLHVGGRPRVGLEQLRARLARDPLREREQALDATRRPVRRPVAGALELRGQREQHALAVGRPRRAGPTSGKPSPVKPAGTAAAGWPVWLNGAV